MKIIDRYLLNQLLGPTLGTLGVLVGLAVLTQALGGFELMVEQRQSSLVFFKIVALATPQLVMTILPIPLLVATLITFNRLHREQEVVVCYAGGMSRWRVIAPAMRIAVAAALLSVAFNLFVQPWAYREMRATLFAARTDLAASLLREGEFTHPAPGVTVYVEDVRPGGRLSNVVINSRQSDGRDTTFSAAEGQIVTGTDRPALILIDGANHSISSEGVLNVLSFKSYTYDLTPLLNTAEELRYKVSDRYLHELLFPDLRQTWEQQNRERMIAEAHGRLANPLHCISFVLMGLAAVIGGGFSRTGYGRRIAVFAGAAMFSRLLGFGVAAACADAPWLNVLQYAVPLATAGFALRVLLRPRESRGLGDAAGPQPVFELEPA